MPAIQEENPRSIDRWSIRVDLRRFRVKPSEEADIPSESNLRHAPPAVRYLNGDPAKHISVILSTRLRFRGHVLSVSVGMLIADILEQSQQPLERVGLEYRYCLIPFAVLCRICLIAAPLYADRAVAFQRLLSLLNDQAQRAGPPGATLRR